MLDTNLLNLQNQNLSALNNLWNKATSEFSQVILTNPQSIINAINSIDRIIAQAQEFNMIAQYLSSQGYPLLLQTLNSYITTFINNKNTYAYMLQNAYAQRSNYVYPMTNQLTPEAQADWLRISQDVIQRQRALGDLIYQNTLNSINSIDSPLGPSSVNKCTAVCPHKIGYTYCGKTCILNANHYGPHECPDGHQWY